MLAETALKSMKVMFATPCYISAVTMNYATSIFTMAYYASARGLDCVLYMRSESLITRGRNMAVAKFLADDSFTHLFWIDSDIAFEPNSVFRLLLADRDIVAGVYPIKRLNWPRNGTPAGLTHPQFEALYTEFPFNPLRGMDRHGEFIVDADGFVEVSEAPTGFMCIKRGVFDKLAAHYPQLSYIPEDNIKLGTEGPNNEKQTHWLFFDCMVEPETRRYLSEDYAFCRRWRDIGGQVWIDLSCKLKHLGQHMFAASLADSLQARKAFIQQD